MDMCFGATLFSLVMLGLWVRGCLSQSEAGFCQVYSYNIKASARLAEKHLFVCCNNVGERTCRGATYQKPIRHESFCSGELIQKGGNHWTQMETSAFPDHGRFYCSGCCGQHIAQNVCHSRFKQAKQQDCPNWVHCFMKECRSVIAAVQANQPLKCALPPPPHPKHFYQEARTLPVNVSRDLSTTKSPPARNVPGKNHSFTCSEQECKMLDMIKRCQVSCCVDYCCLPDGKLPGPDHTVLFGMTTVQLVGTIIGILSLLAAISGLVVLFARRCTIACKGLHGRQHDTQILVIDGPEDVDSDQDPDPDRDSDMDPDEMESV